MQIDWGKYGHVLKEFIGSNPIAPDPTKQLSPSELEWLHTHPVSSPGAWQDKLRAFKDLFQMTAVPGTGMLMETAPFERAVVSGAIKNPEAWIHVARGQDTSEPRFEFSPSRRAIFTFGIPGPEGLEGLRLKNPGLYKTVKDWGSKTVTGRYLPEKTLFVPYQTGESTTPYYGEAVLTKLLGPKGAALVHAGIDPAGEYSTKKGAQYYKQLTNEGPPPKFGFIGSSARHDALASAIARAQGYTDVVHQAPEFTRHITPSSLYKLVAKHLPVKDRMGALRDLQNKIKNAGGPEKYKAAASQLADQLFHTDLQLEQHGLWKAPSPLIRAHEAQYSALQKLLGRAGVYSGLPEIVHLYPSTEALMPEESFGRLQTAKIQEKPK